MNRYLLMLLIFFSGFAVSADKYEWVKVSIENKLPNTPIDKISESPSAGLYTITSGNNVFYYNPSAQVLFFGEFYSIGGTPITEGHQLKAFNKLISKYEADGVVIDGEGVSKKTIVEFVSPNCAYCRKYEDLISQYKNHKRIVFFVSQGNPAADGKLNQVLCSIAPVQNLSLLYDRANNKYIDCEEGKRKLEAHADLARKLGVVGTPTIFVDGQRIDGFNENQIISQLNQ